MRPLFSSLVLLILCWNMQAQTADSTFQKPLEQSLSDTAQWATISNEALLDKAAASYSGSRYPEAVKMYEYLLGRFGPSQELYYNLGNAYYKSERLAPAILNFERALRIDPGDEDARFNLDMCRARIVDKVDLLGQFMVVRWFHQIRDWGNSNFWAACSIGFFLLFIVCLILYFFGRISWLKKFGFFAGVIILIISVWSLVNSAQQHKRLTDSGEAVLYTLSVTVKSSPDKSGTDLFVLHEGTKMNVLSVLGTWSEIELEDGNVGWLESKHIVVI